MKHILIDGTPVSRHIDGLTQYILNVVLRLDTSTTHYTLLMRPNECPTEYAQLLLAKGIEIEEANISPIGPIRDLQFARYLSQHKQFDAAYIPSNQFPLALRLPSLYVIHDLIYEQFPEQLGRLAWLKKYYLRCVVRIGLRMAKKVVAVSNYTRQEILKYHGQQFAHKIQVIHEGWEHLLRNAVADTPAVETGFKQYILYVGSSRGHKNLSRLVAAVKQSQHQIPDGTGVVIVGNTKMFRPEQLQEIQDLNHDKKTIHLTGWVSDQQLNSYFRNAKAFIFPSLSEGFGIPVLEAFFYKIPLLLSNQASLPEVAGDAAIYFDPYDVNDIADKLVQCMKNDNHDTLIAKQTQQLTHYSWEITGKKTQEIIDSI